MAVSRHLGFYRTTNRAIRSADPENPSLEPNMEWIGCTVCEIFTFKLYCDLETGVRGHSRSSKVALFDRAHTTLYSYSIVTMPLSSTLSEIWQHICRKLLVIRSADPENPGLPDMEWIGCIVCEIFAFKLYCDLETGDSGSLKESRSSKVAPLNCLTPNT